MDTAWRYGFWAAALTAMLLSWCCVPELISPPFEPGDLRPPAVVDWRSSAARELRIAFDEAVRAELADFACAEDVGIAAVQAGTDGRELVILLERDQEPGKAFSLSGLAFDLHGNATSFILPFWGHNPRPAGIAINELGSVASASHPDALEFYVKSAGNLAGLAFYVGLRGDYDHRYIFPPCEVAAGDFVVLHLRPQGIESERDELSDKGSSGGLDATPDAWDFWYRAGGGGLPDKNGALSLYDTPGGSIMDALLYSDRGADSTANYGGFGTASFQARATAIVEAGAWLKAADRVSPGDCASSLGITSTRTLNRGSDSKDSDHKDDWHIVPTSGISLGRVNSDAVYNP
ncbi:MAG TPA: hypothetical protein DCG47_07415 [Spirochaetaceae bacterium]|jgi:hypothetical protein|nr:hypothetical protein [Spirochaetaceae bacterium]